MEDEVVPFQGKLAVMYPSQTRHVSDLEIQVYILGTIAVIVQLEREALTSQCNQRIRRESWFCSLVK